MPCRHLALQQPYYYGRKLKSMWTRITENNSCYSGLPLPWIFNCCAKSDQYGGDSNLTTIIAILDKTVEKRLCGLTNNIIYIHVSTIQALSPFSLFHHRKRDCLITHPSEQHWVEGRGKWRLTAFLFVLFVCLFVFFNWDADLCTQFTFFSARFIQDWGWSEGKVSI